MGDVDRYNDVCLLFFESNEEKKDSSEFSSFLTAW
jgi:hypothetical protein